MAVTVAFLWAPVGQTGMKMASPLMLLAVMFLVVSWTSLCNATYGNPRQPIIQDPRNMGRYPSDYSFHTGYTGAYYPEGRPRRDQRIRLTGGYNNDRCLGRVELRESNVSESWSTLCEMDWDYRDASVACYALGCGMLRQILIEPRNAQTPPTRYVNPGCRGTENSLFDCPLDIAGEPGGSLDKDGPLAGPCTGGVARLRCAPPCYLWRSDREYKYRYKRNAYPPFRFHSHTQSCRYPLCAYPGAPPNGKVVGRYLPAYAAGTVLGLECNVGYELKGAAWLHCTHAGLWDDVRPRCEKSKLPRGVARIMIYGVPTIFRSEN